MAEADKVALPRLIVPPACVSRSAAGWAASWTEYLAPAAKTTPPSVVRVPTAMPTGFPGSTLPPALTVTGRLTAAPPRVAPPATVTMAGWMSSDPVTNSVPPSTAVAPV